MPVALVSVRAAFMQAQPRLEETARALGLNWTRTGAPHDALVTDVIFQGQDASVALQLQSATRTMVCARVPGYLCPLSGERVRFAVEGEVTVYSRG
jgi:hypothetical protein